MSHTLLSSRSQGGGQGGHEIRRSPHAEKPSCFSGAVYVPKKIQKPPRPITEVNICVISPRPLGRRTRGYASIAVFTHALICPTVIQAFWLLLFKLIDIALQS